MHIETFQLRNYKSYYDPETVKLTTGFNIVTGKNNAGKTSLLEGLRCNFSPQPHRSLATCPTATSPIDPRSWADVAFHVPQAQFADACHVPGINLFLPVPEPGFFGTVGNDPHKLAKWFFESVWLTFSGTYRADQRTWQGGNPSFGRYTAPSSQFFCFNVNANRTLDYQGQVTTTPNNELGFSIVLPNCVNKIYLFQAERFNIGVTPFGGNKVLATNSANLPEVLNFLQHDSGRFKEFNDLVRCILPDLYWVSVRPYTPGSTNVEIVVWNTSPSLKRADLAIPLSQSGTGIGQVLAILYVVISAEHSQTIIIDEPQSFLHPGASKKLIEVLTTFPQHQYIIATHSPAIISACRPRSITMVRNQSGMSTLQQLDVSKNDQTRVYLSEVGASLSDLFGADYVLWVEGATEEICFTMILDHSRKRLLGTVIRGVRSTGEFEGKHADAVVEIYGRITGAANLLPPALSFIFDSELRTESAKEDIRRRATKIQGQPRVLFTERRMYENYLLDAEAIKPFLDQIDEGKERDYDIGKVQQTLSEKLSDPRYRSGVDETKMQEPPENWVNAPVLLRDVFSSLTGGRVSVFSKTEHSVWLTEWLLGNKPEALEEVEALIARALTQANPA